MAFNLTKATTGEFQEKDYGKWFTYRASENTFGLPHEIDVLDGTRFAKVMKTVAYVAVDEDADGNPVLEKWDLKKHHVYQ